MEHDSGSILNVVNDIRSDIDKNKDRIYDQLQEEIDKEKKELKVSLKKHYQEILEKDREKILAEMQNFIDMRELELKHAFLEYKNELFTDFLAEFTSSLDNYRKTKEYKKIIKQALKSKKKSKKITIDCHPKDSKEIKKLLPKAKINKNEDVVLGVVINDAAKGERIDMSFASILEKKEKGLAKIFFNELQ